MTFYKKHIRVKIVIVARILKHFGLILFGRGSVAVTVLLNAHQGLMQIAIAWGMGFTLAIYATRHLSCTHLNPALSCAMVFNGRMKEDKLPVYLISQFLGAVLAGLAIYILFGPTVSNFEAVYQIIP